MQVGVKIKAQCKWFNKQIKGVLVGKGYTQTYGIDFEKKFSLIVQDRNFEFTNCYGYNKKDGNCSKWV